MFKSLCIAILFSLTGAVAGAAELTAQETRWLQAAGPVLAYARQQGLPIDIVVQPQARPTDVPMAMGFDGARCKLVLSMRGGADDADAIFASVAEVDQPLMIEAMAAHEVAHCWRYVRGVWHALPAGFTTGDGGGHVEPAQLRALREMRREEGFSDLVALAWTARRHPARYAAVLGWLRTVRGAAAGSGAGHDTMVWVALAGDAASFTQAASPFEAADPLWSAGLLHAD